MPARVRVVHTLVYSFAEPVRGASLTLCLSPRPDARQLVEAHAISVTPQAETRRGEDERGNLREHLVFDGELRTLAISAATTLSLPPPRELTPAVGESAREVLRRAGVDLTAATRAHRGLCRERTERAVALLDAAGVPARYLSGYPRVEGRTEPHAWLAFELPRHGFVEYDPTSACLAPPHLLLAWGRSYDDVAPVAGTLQAGGGYRLRSTVTVSSLP